jgi:hypothetical protein
MLGYPSILYKESISEVMMNLRHRSVTCIIFLYFITVHVPSVHRVTLWARQLLMYENFFWLFFQVFFYILETAQISVCRNIKSRSNGTIGTDNQTD